MNVRNIYEIMSILLNIVKDLNNVMYFWVLIDWYSFLGVLLGRNDDVSIEEPHYLNTKIFVMVGLVRDDEVDWYFEYLP